MKYADLEPPLCWQQVFGNSAPVEIEIGFGKCGFLLEIAAQNPATNFVGIELSRKYYRKGVAKVQRAGLPNIKLLWGEAFHLFERYVPDHSLAQIHINCPDPWPKKRHAKRRLVQAELVALFAQKSNPDGSIEIATDAEAYMLQVQEIFRANALYAMTSAHTSNQQGSIRPYSSDYERMFLDAGKTIHYVKYSRRTD